jgi:hypothetical protein
LYYDDGCGTLQEWDPAATGFRLEPLQRRIMEDERYQYLHDWRMKAQAKDPDYLRRKALKELYHTTVEWYELKLEEQDNHCALCSAVQQSTHGKRLSVDHNHNCCPAKRACGKCNRGLLCFNCNKRLGILEIFMRESTRFSMEAAPGTWLSKALAYLDRYAPTQA